MPAQFTSAEGVSPNFLIESLTESSFVTSVGSARELGIFDCNSLSFSSFKSMSPTL